MNNEDQVGEQITPFERMKASNPKWMESSPPDPIENLPAPRIEVEPMQLPQVDQTSSQGNSDGFNGGDTEQDQFKVYPASFTEGVGEDPDTYGFRVNPGYLIMRVAAAGGGPDGGGGFLPTNEALVRVMPLMNGLLPLDHPDVEELPAEAGNSIYLKVVTDKTDTLKTDGATIVVAPSDQESTHYQPVSPESTGIDGVYYYKIADFEIDEETGALTEIKQIQGDGPIIHTPNLWTGENVGTGARVFKTRDQALDKYQFRNILGIGAITASEAGGDIEVRITGGADLNLRVWALSYTKETVDGVVGVLVFYTESERETHFWRDGIYIGTTDPEDGLGDTRDVTYMELYGAT